MVFQVAKLKERPISITQNRNLETLGNQGQQDFQHFNPYERKIDEHITNNPRTLRRRKSSRRHQHSLQRPDSCHSNSVISDQSQDKTTMARKKEIKPLDKAIDRLMPILSLIESSNNPKAVNKSEDAVGLYQLRPIYVKDVNRISKTTHLNAFTLKDRYDIAKSKTMVKIYLSYWGKKTRVNPKSEHDWIIKLGQIHNGGPNGHKKKSTLEYARKITEGLNEYSSCL